MNTFEQSTTSDLYEQERSAIARVQEPSVDSLEAKINGLIELETKPSVSSNIPETPNQESEQANTAEETVEGLADVPTPDDLQPVDPISTELQPSEFNNLLEQEEQAQGDSWFSQGLKGLEWLASPLISIGDAAIAPIAHQYESEGFLNQAYEAFEVSAKAAKDRLLPTLGEDHEHYARSIVDRNLQGAPELIKSSATVALDMITDPSVIISMPLAKTIQAGMDIAKSNRHLVNGGESFKGIFQEGIMELLTVGRTEIDPSKLGKVGKLAVKADSGDKEALNKLSMELKNNPAIAEAVKNKQIKDRMELDTLINNKLGNPKDPAFTMTMVEGAKDLMDTTLNGNARIVGHNTNLSKLNTEADVNQMMVNIGNIHKENFKKAAGKSGQTKEMILSQSQQLSDLIGKPASTFLPEESYALRQMLVSSATQLGELAKNTVKMGASDIDMLAFDKAYAVHMMIQEKATGVASHAGRLLQSHAVTADGTAPSVQAIKKLIEQSGDNPETKRALRVALAETNDPEAIAKMVGKLSLGDKVSSITFELFANSILSGPITHAINVTSNASTLAYSPTLSFMQGMTAAARLDFQESALNMVEGTAKLTGLAKGIGDAFRHLARKSPRLGKNWEDLDLPFELKGQHELDANKMKKAIDSKTLEFQGNTAAIVDFIGKGVRIPGAALVEEDMAFKIMHYRMETNAQAVRKAAAAQGSAMDKRAVYTALKNNPDEEIIEQAVDTAKYYTFTNDLGTLGTNAHNIIRNTPLKFMIPFFKTPTNIFKMGVRNGVLGNMFKDLGPALMSGGAKGDAARARIAIGTAMPLAFISYMDERITGKVDMATPEGRYKAQHVGPPYSIKIGDEWISYERIEPLRSILGLMTNYRDAVNSIETIDPETGMENDFGEQLFTGAVAPFIDTMRDATIMGTMGNILDMLDGVASGNPEYTKKNFQRLAAQLTVPFSGAVGQINTRLIDNKYRMAEGYVEQIHKMIPGLSDELPPVLTVWGDEQLYPEGLGPDIISAITTKTIPHDKYDVRMVELGVPIPGTPKAISVGGIALELTPKQRYNFSLIRGKGFEDGPTLKETFIEIMDDPTFQTLSDIDQAEYLKSRFTQATEHAKSYLMETDYELAEQWDMRNEALQKQRRRTER